MVEMPPVAVNRVALRAVDNLGQRTMSTGPVAGARTGPETSAVRWTRFFDDLDAQFDAESAADDRLEVSDRTRRELAGVSLADRLRASRGRVVDLVVDGMGRQRLDVRDVGPDWVLGRAESGHDVVIQQLAISGAWGLAAGAVSLVSEVDRRVGMGQVLRGLARDRAGVALWLRDGSSQAGRLDRVAADYLELADPHGVIALRAVAGVQICPA